MKSYNYYYRVSANNSESTTPKEYTTLTWSKVRKSNRIDWFEYKGHIVERRYSIMGYLRWIYWRRKIDLMTWRQQ